MYIQGLFVSPTANFTVPKVSLPPEEKAPVATKFVPYTSVLSLMRKPNSEVNDASEVDAIGNYEKKKNNKTTKFAKKCLNPLNANARVMKSKVAMVEKMQVKKEKSEYVRKKRQAKIAESIEILDSEDSDSVLPVDVPSAPVITLFDSSDDEEIAKKKRSHSPSNSSIVSDDFIASSDKKRATTAFKENEMKNSAQKLKQILKKQVPKRQSSKIKELIKSVKQHSQPTSASSSSRSSCERTVKSAKSDKTKKDTQQNFVELNEESVYDAKLRKSKTQNKPKPDDSSDDETPCVNVTNVKCRRKSTSSARKSTDPDSDQDIESPAVVKVKKRSRLITPRYNDDEFASMISTIVNKRAIIEEESEVESSAERNSAVKGNEVDCEILEKSVETIDIADTEDLTAEDDWVEPVLKKEKETVVDSDNDSINDVPEPVNCELSLHVHSNFTPHEFTQNATGSSNAIIASLKSEVGWNDEMKYFYDGSWGGEHFKLYDQLNSMSRDPNDWKISNDDRMRSFNSADKSIRCRNCNEFGHIAVRCTRPRKMMICYMCGEEGHRETRCPNAICLRCGKPSRTFTTVCGTCHKLNRRVCPLCHFPGHDIDYCPDKWRRYHSTTTDSNELDNNFEVNPRQYCSICARRGHFAENCSQFLKTINGLITSSPVRIMSHKPSYTRNIHTSFDNNSRTDQQVLNLFSYFENFKFNFDLGERAQVYKRFMLHYMKFKQVQPRAIADTSTSQPDRKKNGKRKRKANKDRDDRQHNVSIPSNCEDSNYSFSEFYEEGNSSQTQQEVVQSAETTAESPQHQQEKTVNQSKPHQFVMNPFAAPLPDFIPLSSNASNEQNVKITKRNVIIIHQEEEVSTAKMMLTKEHCLMLNNEKGKDFLMESQERNNVTAAFNWSNAGNAISITGRPSSQSQFHADVREYLYRLELEKYEKLMESSAQLPKNKANLVRQLKENLHSVHKLNISQAKKTLTMMLSAQQSLDHKRALKCRKTLNIAFLGSALLCDGGNHLTQLRKILFTLEEDLSQGNLDVKNEIRDEIRKHMRPIFGTVDHGDYKKLFIMFKNIKQKHKFVPNPIALK